MVLARVVRVRRGQVDVVIVVVYGVGDGESGEGDVCADEWQAVIRREDVRATEKEKVVCSEGFRVGDVVRGVVVCQDLPYYDVSLGLLSQRAGGDMHGRMRTILREAEAK